MKHLTGNSFTDDRGFLLFNNSLDLSEVKRLYTVENKDIEILRAWQGHKIEKRWFVAIQGAFKIRIIKIDCFQNPSDDLVSENFILQSKSMDCLIVEAGFASSIQAIESNSKLLVFSNYKLGEVNDDYKFNSQKWSQK